MLVNTQPRKRLDRSRPLPGRLLASAPLRELQEHGTPTSATVGCPGPESRAGVLILNRALCVFAPTGSCPPRPHPVRGETFVERAVIKILLPRAPPAGRVLRSTFHPRRRAGRGNRGLRSAARRPPERRLPGHADCFRGAGHSPRACSNIAARDGNNNPATGRAGSLGLGPAALATKISRRGEGVEAIDSRGRAKKSPPSAGGDFQRFTSNCRRLGYCRSSTTAP